MLLPSMCLLRSLPFLSTCGVYSWVATIWPPSGCAQGQPMHPGNQHVALAVGPAPNGAGDHQRVCGKQRLEMGPPPERWHRGCASGTQRLWAPPPRMEGRFYSLGPESSWVYDSRNWLEQPGSAKPLSRLSYSRLPHRGTARSTSPELVSSQTTGAVQPCGRWRGAPSDERETGQPHIRATLRREVLPSCPHFPGKGHGAGSSRRRPSHLLHPFILNPVTL